MTVPGTMALPSNTAGIRRVRPGAKALLEAKKVPTKFSKFFRLNSKIEGPFGAVPERELKNACKSFVNSLIPLPENGLEFLVAGMEPKYAVFASPDWFSVHKKLGKIGNLAGMEAGHGSDCQFVSLVFPEKISGADRMVISFSYVRHGLSMWLEKEATVAFKDGNNDAASPFKINLEGLYPALKEFLSDPTGFINKKNGK